MRTFDYMTMQNTEYRHRQLLIGIVVVILIGTQGVTAVNAANNQFRPMSVDAQVSLKTADEEGGEPAKVRCKECGVIASTQGLGPDIASVAGRRDAHALPTGSSNGAQIFIRMADGSSRSIRDASTANWRAGERVIVIN
ncbi:MAG: hypothetical protein KKF85_02155 [Gammaproteobacteria bacterium]|nr:hypothetical protein [Rhodocyclaceae bacterium]MBU3908628.1 hypothetical protein [Gammaproteobacteria bacterium]MBU3988553.1 hypothetical protein [Gammaproteobacteria bacterium]MBU4004656.1 hypothetical protein [Gammaproteobacteria bacterium]MBU4021259.1 hypothetical protein [Gammaproteobacteria bacterium]